MQFACFIFVTFHKYFATLYGTNILSSYIFLKHFKNFLLAFMPEQLSGLAQPLSKSQLQFKQTLPLTYPRESIFALKMFVSDFTSIDIQDMHVC